MKLVSSQVIAPLAPSLSPTLALTLALALALAAPLAHAGSAASASLSFTVLASSGFSWLTAPVSTADSSATAAELTGFEFAAGVFSPGFGPAVTANDLALGVAVPASTANASAGPVFASAFSFGNANNASLQASALVPGEGRADATSFARSFFSLAPGASVTFQGALFLSVTGNNPSLPANYSLGDFYGFASGLLAAGSDTVLSELGGPAGTGMAGSYSLNNIGPLSLTVTNTTGSPFTSFLDSGVTVYSASVVPEPGTYALLIAGLATVGFVVRRKSQTTPSA